MKMKKLLACVLSAGILFSLAACGGNGNGGLSELPTYEQDKEFLIGGWDVPPDTEEAFRIASEMGLTFMFMNATFAGYGTDRYREMIATAGKQGVKSMLMFGNGQNQPQNAYEWAAAYKDDPNVIGINYWDEPSVSTLDSTIKEFAEWHDMQFVGTDKSFYVNLYPTYVSSDVLKGSYDEYLETYTEIVTGVETGASWISVDYYPLKLAASGSAVDTGWLGNLEMLAKVRKDNDIDTFHSFLLSTQHMDYREIEEEDLRYQAWVNMAYGVNAMTYFTYRQSLDPKFSTALVDMQGNPTDKYYDAQQVNEELHAMENVYLSFDWEGVYTVTGSQNEYVDANGVSDYFRRLQYSLDSLEGVKSVEATQDTLIGQFRDAKGNKGFVVANFADPYYGKESADTVTIHFEHANRAIICRGTDVKTYEVTDNTLTLDLQAGEGAFVVPVWLNR